MSVVSSARLTNLTYALPAVKLCANISAKVSSNNLKLLSAHLAFHMCVGKRASKSMFCSNANFVSYVGSDARRAFGTAHLRSFLFLCFTSCVRMVQIVRITNSDAQPCTPVPQIGVWHCICALNCFCLLLSLLRANGSSSTNYKPRRTTEYANASSRVNCKSTRKNNLK